MIPRKSFIQIACFFFYSAFLYPSYGQLPVDDETGKVKYTEVVELAGMTKEAIYQKAKLWMVSTLKSGDNMVELSGENSDQLVGTGNIILSNVPALSGKSHMRSSHLNFKFLVFCKDEKMMYSVENFTLSYVYSTLPPFSTGISPFSYPLDLGEKAKEKFETAVRPILDGEIRVTINDFVSNMKKEQSTDW